MASNANITPAPVQQPGLRSFIVCDRLPLGCLAVTIADEHNLPHLRPGDVAIIDPDDKEPAEGELFCIRWNDGGRSIVELWQRAGIFGCGPNREMIETVCWLACGCNRPRTADELREWMRLGKSGGLVDGPYATEGPNAWYLP
ncbi:hypothetical protein ACT009_11630 [Sphingomonas sp. Tas61C01]|uniref:hypothetical protein n=1 Tax=Sphingomonas sp. Tas61C01 TaxID=3458297 RepID=UPI00403E81E5